ncbi:MAG TPA: 50S ribosomal protein L30 [Syntrophales bacterium]|nr:50S ribosomal protein L30 [Syntrophales bacterium]HOD97464.1 50S ribosomal protein L30 [Syntrophales bacterium]HOH72119.1 50S ribosomal protein L30 [Syntrophales bacterium]HPN07708.1 50S ribosomal protein L30 [Syntrophales bacterium]HPX80754.1 50S ribosomal protein L30 [Syntrophales bacterium]
MRSSLVGRKLKITLIRSYIGRPEKHRQVLRGLGLMKMNKTVILADTPEVRGMVNKVCHLVSMEEVEA